MSRVRASFELHCWHRTRWAIPSAGGRVWHAPQLFLHSSPIHLPVHLRQDQSSSAALLPDSSGQVAKHGSVKMAGTSPAAKPHPRPRLALADRVLAHVRRRWCGHDTCDAHESSAEVAHYTKAHSFGVHSGGSAPHPRQRSGQPFRAICSDHDSISARHATTAARNRGDPDVGQAPTQLTGAAGALCRCRGNGADRSVQRQRRAVACGTNRCACGRKAGRARVPTTATSLL